MINSLNALFLNRKVCFPDDYEMFVTDIKLKEDSDDFILVFTGTNEKGKTETRLVTDWDDLKICE